MMREDLERVVDHFNNVYKGLEERFDEVRVAGPPRFCKSSRFVVCSQLSTHSSA